MYFVVHRIPPEQYIHAFPGNTPGWGCSFGFNSDETELLVATKGATVAADKFDLVRKVDSVALETIWNAIAAGSHAVKHEHAASDELPGVVG